MSLEVIQIIEDDPDQAALIDREVRKAGYRTNVAPDGPTGLSDIRRLHPALVVLDIMLPGMDGYDVCRRLREDPETQEIPIIMMSALGTERHKTEGLELGADDYVVKPFGLAELISRIRAVLRRSLAQAGYRPDGGGAELLLQEDHYVALFRGRRLTLTGPEWHILRRLVRSAGRVVMREELIDLVWGKDGLIHDTALERHVKSLLDKLGDDPVTPSIIASFPTGYVLTERRQKSS